MTAQASEPTSLTLRRGERWLRLAWIALIIIAIYVLVLFAFSFTVPKPPGSFATDPTARANLEAAGLTPQLYDAIQQVLAVTMGVVCYCVGLVLLWRRPMDRMALLVAFLLIMFLTITVERPVVARMPPVLTVPGEILRFAFGILAPAFFFLFPDGRWVPRWTRWVVLVWVILTCLQTFGPPPDGRPPAPWFVVLNTLALSTVLGSLVAAPVYRYRRVAGPRERQQIKWLIAGVAGTIVPTIVFFVIDLAFPTFVADGSLVYVIGQSLIVLAALLIPISIGIAMLRYRLYDVDIIIRRTLIYSALTALLALIYVGSIVVLEALLRPLVGAETEWATVASTLAIAALFNPLRRRIQAIIDRRFYRRKYDAHKTLQAFSSRLREETDLERLSDDVIAVVQDTMQPAHVSLWLKPVEREVR